MNSPSFRLAAVCFALATSALALPVDLSAPPGGLGPTSDQGAAVHWVEMAEIDFGGGLTLPVRLSFLSSRAENGRDFGAGQWRSPLHDSRLLEKQGGRWPVLLPCGKVMALVPMAEGKGWATPDGEWVATTKGAGTLVSRADGWEMEFNKRGQLIRLRNDTGRDVLWIRDGQGTLQSLAEATQGKLAAPAYTVQRGAAGSISSMKMHTALGELQWKFSFDGAQQLQAIAFPDTSTVSCAYSVLPDGSPQIAITGRDAITSKLAWHTVTRSLVSDGLWTYDIQPQQGNNPVMRRTGPNGEVEIQHDDALTSRMIFTSAEGTQTIRQKVTSGPAKGKLQSITRILGENSLPKTADRNQTLYIAAYDANGLLATETDALGHQTKHAYTLHGSSVHTGIKTYTLTNPLGAKTVKEFDRHGNLIAETNALGHTFSHDYDLHNRRIKTTGPDGIVVEMVSYNSQGKIESRTDALGAVTKYGYDSQGNQISETDPLGNITRHEYNVRGNRTATTDALGRTTRYEYDAGGRLTGTVAVADKISSNHYSYDDKGRRISTTAPDGAFASIDTYDAFGRITSKTDALRHVTKFEYELNKGAFGCKACSISAHPTRITSPGGRIIERTFDSEGRLLTSTTAPGSLQAATTSQTYDLAGHLTSTTDPLNRTTTFEYDDAGHRIRVIYPDKTSRSYAFNALGRIVAITNELGKTEKREYDTHGNLTAVIDSEGHTARTIFGDGSTVSAARESENLKTGHAALHRPTMTISAAGERTQFDYDVLGRRIAITKAPGTPEASTTRREYDAVGNEIATITNIGAPGSEPKKENKEQKTTHVYDSRNRRITTTDALNRTWTFVYDDDAGPSGPAPCCGADPATNIHATEIIHPDGGREQRLYSLKGQLIETRDANLTAVNDKLLAEKRELRKGIQYAYDSDGHLVELTDANGHSTKWRYDVRGRLAAKTYPDGTAELYEHDAAGQLVNRVRPDGIGAHYTYDLGGRLIGVEWSDGKTENSTFAYDAAGHLTMAENKSAKIHRTYNSRGLVEKEVQQISPWVGHGPTATKSGQPFTAEVGYQYDADGRLSQLTYPDKSAVGYHYNSRGELAQVGDLVVNQEPKTYLYTRRTDGKIVQLSFPNGAVTHKSYDKVGRLTEVEHLGSAGKVLFSEASNYDQRDRRIARIQDDGKADFFAYDRADQIIAAAYDHADGSSVSVADLKTKGDPASENPIINFKPAQTFEYDPAGNRQSTFDNGMTTKYRTNEANQYTQIESVISGRSVTVEPAFDKRGNLLHDDSNNYAWDADIHLMSVTARPMTTTLNGGAPSSVTSFRYDPLHRRVARHDSTNNTVTLFIHDGWNVLAEYRVVSDESRPQLASRQVWGEDLLGSLQKGGGIGGLLASVKIGQKKQTRNEFHCDSQGNVVGLTNEQGQESARYRYDVFGRTILAQGPDANANYYRFSTKFTESSSGLVYYGYRYYSPNQGRWPSRDPLGERGGINLFGAFANNANKHIDPDGRVLGYALAELAAAAYKKWGPKCDDEYGWDCEQCCDLNTIVQMTAHGIGIIGDIGETVGSPITGCVGIVKGGIELSNDYDEGEDCKKDCWNRPIPIP